MISSGPFTIVALATVFIFCGKFMGPALGTMGGFSSVIGKSLSVASSVDSHRRTGGFSLADFTTMPSDSDRNLTLDFCNKVSCSSESEISLILGLEMGLTMSLVSLRVTLFFDVSFLSTGGGGETEESELKLTKVEEGDSSRFLSSFKTSGRLNFLSVTVDGFAVDTADFDGFLTAAD